MPYIRRFDRVELRRPSIKRTDEGYLRGEAIVTRTGIFLYKDPDGTIRRELRHPRDVFAAASMDTLKMIPVILGHPDTIFVTAENAKTLQVGYTGEGFTVDGDYVIITLTITDEEAIKAIEQGRRELSCAYTAMRDDFEGGTWEDQKYDFKQIDINYNHIAIVSEGRAGAMARLNLDSTDAYQIDQIEEVNMPEKILKSVVLDSISYEAAPEIVNALEREKKRADDLQKQLDGYIEVKIEDQAMKAPPQVAAAFEKLRGAHDGLKEKLDAAEKKTSGEEIQKRVKERQQIVSAAERVVDEDTAKKLDEMGDADIMREVVIQSAAEDKRDALRTDLKDATELYIEGRFAQAVQDLPAQKTDAAAPA